VNNVTAASARARSDTTPSATGPRRLATDHQTAATNAVTINAEWITRRAVYTR
jgi:hypothetical protein